jgi:hypothetical protein
MVGNGRYVRMTVKDSAGRELVIACAVDSVAGLDDESLDERLKLLFERAVDNV